jgi:hypothetical protein
LTRKRDKTSLNLKKNTHSISSFIFEKEAISKTSELDLSYHINSTTLPDEVGEEGEAVLLSYLLTPDKVGEEGEAVRPSYLLTPDEV